MKITTTTTLRTGEPGAYEFVSPNSSIHLNRKVAQALIDRGFAAQVKSVCQQEGLPSAQGLVDEIIDAIDDVAPNDFGKDGKPSVKAIEEIMGVNISAADRDEAWENYQTLLAIDDQ